jgi:hypothetical protein
MLKNEFLGQKTFNPNVLATIAPIIWTKLDGVSSNIYFLKKLGTLYLLTRKIKSLSV